MRPSTRTALQPRSCSRAGRGAPRRGRTWSPRRRGPPAPARAACFSLLRGRRLQPRAERGVVDGVDAVEQRRPRGGALFACRWPTRCQRRPSARRSARAATLASASCTLFSPKSRRPAAKASRTASAGCVLLTATRVTSSGRRPARAAARAMRSRTAATRSAITSSASAPEEPLGGGHVLRVGRVHGQVLLEVRDGLRDLVLAEGDGAQVVVRLGVGWGRSAIAFLKAAAASSAGRRSGGRRRC